MSFAAPDRSTVLILLWLIAALLIANDFTLAACAVLALGLLGQDLLERHAAARLAAWSIAPDAIVLDASRARWHEAFSRIERLHRRHVEAHEANTRELERLHAAVNLMPDGLIVMDAHNHVQWFNQSAAQLHGLSAIQRPIDHFIRQPEFTRTLESSEDTGPVTLNLPSHPGRTHLLRLVRTPDSWRLLITRDITEQYQRDTMRRDFVANVSHEIRTPLTVVHGYVETLLEIDLPPAERRAFLQITLKQTVIMQRLLADLLTLSRLESAHERPPEEWIAMDQLLDTLVADARSLSGGRHDLTLERADAVEVRAVPDEIESAVRNLLTNAIRYTPEGGQIRVRWVHQGESAVLSVEDTGIGIAQEHLPRLTERFYRVDRSRSRDTGGTGLGLAIVKHITNRHGATLSISSTVGRGSRFKIAFYRDRLQHAAGAHEALVPQAAAPSEDLPQS